MLSLCAAASCVTGKQEKDYLRRFRSAGRLGARAGRPAGRGFTPDFAQSRRIWLSYSEVGDDAKPELLWVMAA